ncbi:MAG: hypothetical protein BWK79_14740 [Beggiatoa sp. IS2]|nr:MAG: hypothetical protein BWK79_14740 [Beggiatoa sp. IS2]
MLSVFRTINKPIDLNMKQRILHLSDYEAFEYLANGKNIVEIQRLLLHDEHLDNALAEFDRSLQHQPHLPVAVVIDTLQEEYQRGLIPHVMGKDRQQLIDHKMRRLFEYTAFNHATFQGREIGGRGDDRVLFTALNNPAFVQPWLERLNAHKVPLLGLYSLPLLSQQLLKYLPRAPYTLLLAPTPPINANTVQGIRQTFFAQQQLQFSRLLPLTNSENEIDYVIAQINQVQNFLSNSRILPINTTLLVIILASTDFVYALDDFLDKNKPSNMNIETIDIIEFSHYLGLQIPENQVYLHTLAIYDLIQAPVKNHYARKIDLRYAMYRQVRRGIYVTSLLILLGSILTSSWYFIAGFQEQQKVATILSKIKSQESLLQELRKEQSALPLEIELIRDIAVIGRHVKGQDIPLQISWLKFSQVFKQCQNLMLERLEWGIASSTTELNGLFTQTIAENPTEENKETTPEQASTLPENFTEGLRLSGRVDPFQGNFLEAELLVKRCVEKLQPQFTKTKLLLSPLSKMPKEVLQGQLDNSGATSKTVEAQFMIEILIDHAAKQ